MHRLKTWTEPFRAIAAGLKRYELRLDDRGFAVGDELVLLEYIPAGSREPEGFTGGALRARVTYKTWGGTFGLPEELCVLGIALLREGGE